MNLNDKKNMVKKLQNLIDAGMQFSPEFSRQMLEENCHTELSHPITDHEGDTGFCGDTGCIHHTSSEMGPEDSLRWLQLGPW